MIYDRLIAVAQSEGCISYREIAPLGGLRLESPADRNELAGILGEISKYEDQNGRPMLSAVVIRQDPALPGEGFFKLARELGLYRGGDKTEFHIAELRRVHEYWRSGPPTSISRILERATDLGIPDLAEQHDHYLYGSPKRCDQVAPFS